MSLWIVSFSLVSISDLASVSFAFQNAFYSIEALLLATKPSTLAFLASLVCFAFGLFQNRLYR